MQLDEPRGLPESTEVPFCRVEHHPSGSQLQHRTLWFPLGQSPASFRDEYSVLSQTHFLRAISEYGWTLFRWLARSVRGILVMRRIVNIQNLTAKLGAAPN